MRVLSVIEVSLFRKAVLRCEAFRFSRAEFPRGGDALGEGRAP